MSRVEFATGKPHQERAAVWARRRLADSGGRRFERPEDQDGVLFADGVGAGKTWEALAAAALILYKQKHMRGRQHVLILCPANLVTKWEDELSGAAKFREYLERWRRRLERTGSADAAWVVEETLKHVLPIRSARDVRREKKWKGLKLPGGTYIVSQTLITRQSPRLSVLRNSPWDVLIVDEAHNAIAQQALKQLESKVRKATKLFLSATPFQLRPSQWNNVTKQLLRGGRKILGYREIPQYIEGVSATFGPEGGPGPSHAVVRAASEVFRRFVARSVQRTSGRAYALLNLDGSIGPLARRLDELDDTEVQALLQNLRATTERDRDLKFENAYLERRFSLATRREATLVATALRRSLAGGVGGHDSPRLKALARWANTAFEKDIDRSLKSGTPHKTVVFSSWVGEPNQGEAAVLKRMLAAAFERALRASRKKWGVRWRRWLQEGRRRLTSPRTDRVWLTLSALAHDELTAVMAGRHSSFTSGLVKRLSRRAAAMGEVKDSLREDLSAFEVRTIRRRLSNLRSAFSPWTWGRHLKPVERYTGHEGRSARDRVATAFREVGSPWVLVATNVGSEGIDLQTYTSRIVHYDLEWNPARMEQREGRGDRVGREHTDPIQVLYCLVPRTYDERMFHQLVARDRWHGVLLGKPALKLDSSSDDAPLLARAKLERMRLDLRPR